MRVAVARAPREGAPRVAMVPELVAKLSALGHEVLVEPGAGAGALHTDEAYAAAGAVLADDPYSDAELVCSVQPLPRDLARRLASGTVTVSF
ncbi:MAG: NAD(P)(+) transhydrogenase (Re/Si-specific) subunit alpha, partial [Actinomycetota bacterium]|nr:NAD(P)(+) transhydrogenase (Re/Si-specific) subunit alpha [Actinomycetota bacterium]